MKKNGFTMVELLATMVILGILMVFSLPAIFGMLERNRNKIYTNDAKEFISRVEYQLRSKSAYMDKPSPEDCIIVGLEFLDDEEFGSPPNGGVYSMDHSFVVVRNHDNGKLDYSVTLIEAVKGGGYKGIGLTRDGDIITGEAVKKVKAFQETDLLSISNGVTKSDINSALGDNYIEGNVSKVYSDSNVYGN